MDISGNIFKGGIMIDENRVKKMAEGGSIPKFKIKSRYFS